jgi:hypothetical protein
VSLVLLETVLERKPNYKSTINAFLTKDFMNELQQAIEGYNQEKMFITDKYLNMTTQYNNAILYEASVDRVKQIDMNIERLLTFQYYPNPEKSFQGYS